MTEQKADTMTTEMPRNASALVRFGLWIWVLVGFAAFAYQFADLIGPALSVFGL